MTCFTWTLVPIAFVGILLYFFKPPGVTVDDNPLLPLYEVLMAFWAISFLTVSGVLSYFKSVFDCVLGQDTFTTYSYGTYQGN